MRRLFLPIFVFLLLVGGNGLLEAFELDVIWGVNNLTFDPEKTSSYTESGTEIELKPYLYKLVNLSIRHDISETLNFCLNIERDNILQDSVNAEFGIKTDNFGVKFGPFLGVVDYYHISDIGITGILELIAPGAVFLSIDGSSTLSVPYGLIGNNSRETAGIKLGFWMGNIIPSFSASIKSLSSQEEENLVLDDTLYKFLASLDFFAKNSNVSGYISYGYQVYTRVYKKGGLESSDKLSTLLAGFGLNFQVTRPLEFKIGFEMPFRFSTTEPITAPKFWFISKAYAGFVYTFAKKGIYD